MKQMLQNYREVLAVRSVRTVLVAAGVSLAGDAAAMVALVLRVHASGVGPWAVALLLLVSAVPVALTMGVSGALADRGDPRRVLLVTALVQSAAALALATVDGLAATLVLVLVLQTGFALGDPSWAAVVPRLVPDGQAGRVVALQHALRGVAAPAGAAAGGVLVQWHGASTALLLDAVTFLALAGAAVALPRALAERGSEPAEAADPTATGVRRARWSALLLPRDGVAALRAHPVLGVLVAALLPFVVTVEAVNVVEVFLVRDVLGASAAQFGYLGAVMGAAAVVGAVLAGGVSSTAGRVRGVLGGIALVALTMVGIGLVPTYLVLLGLVAVVGLLLGSTNALVMGLLLDDIGPERRGSVVAVVGGASRGASVLALALGGLGGSLVGARVTYVAAGGASLLVAALAAWAVNRSMDARSTARVSSAEPAPSTLEV